MTNNKFPPEGEIIEIFIDGIWKEATFNPSDSFINKVDDEEIWWCDHYQLVGGGTIPDNIWTDDPNFKDIEWRPKRP